MHSCIIKYFHVIFTRNHKTYFWARKYKLVEFTNEKLNEFLIGCTGHIYCVSQNLPQICTTSV